MKPRQSVCTFAVCRLDGGLEALEERLAPAIDTWLDSVDSRPVSTTGVGDPEVSGAPITAANLAAVQQQFPNTTGDGYAIAVLDTGVDYKHPALGGGIGAGYKVVAGYNFVNPATAGYTSSYPVGPNPMDENGHGTNVAGIAAAKDPTYGGVAPDADIVALRVLDKYGSGAWLWVEQALQWVIDHRTQYNIVAVNMSLGAGNYTGLTSDFTAIQGKLQTLWQAGVVNVASSGNNFYSNGSVAGIQFPAISQWAVAVGAVYDGSYGKRTWGSGAIDYITYKDKIASFTQRSGNLDILAPGALITSAGLSNGGNATYWTYAGTSQASPFVAAAALLVHQRLDQTGNGALATADYIVSLLEFSGALVADSAPPSEDNVGRTNLVFPRLDILKALQAIQPAGFAADAYEANETKTTAKNLGYFATSASFSGMTLHTATDKDWYSFVTTTAGTYRIQTPVSAGTGQATFTFYDVSTNNPRTIPATIVNGVATLDVYLRNNVRYFVEGKSANGKTAAYGLTIVNQAASTPPPPLAPDAKEVNDVVTQAKYIGSFGNGSVTGLNLHTTTDQDWFRFNSQINGNQTIRVVADGNPNKVTFTFYDYTKGKERTIPATFVNGVATLTVSLKTGVNYFLQAKSASGATVPYRIDFGTGASSASEQAFDDWDAALAAALDDRDYY